MALYYFDMVGIDEDDVGAVFPSHGEARTAAIVYLAEYLRDYPGYATQGHWQVDVYDENRSILFSVIVSTVDVPAVRASA